jgi:1,4-dihydroxy-2-naphthoate octaprenyltransferase
MEPKKPTLTSEILRISHPWILLASILFYALGGGVEIYQSGSVRWDVYWGGQLVVLLLLLSIYFLREYFSLPVIPLSRRSEPAPVFNRNGLLLISATALTAGAVLTVMLFASGALTSPAILFLGLAFIIAMMYAIPPLRLAYSGYGELVFSILQANLVPGLAFLLQSGVFQRILPLLTFPLTFLYLASYLALHLQRYSEDIHLDRKTMLTRLGWQRGMALHNLLILLGFLVMGISAIFGLPWSLTWPGLLGLPVGIFQILQMNWIAGGAKPRWRLLAITAGATVALTTYFITLALWTA